MQNEKVLHLVVRVWPKSAQAHYNLGCFLYEKLKNEDEAEREIREAIALKPRFRGAYYYLAWLLEERKAELDEIEEMNNRMIKHFPDDPITYRNLGLDFFQQDRLPEAGAVLSHYQPGEGLSIRCGLTSRSAHQRGDSD